MIRTILYLTALAVLAYGVFVLAEIPGLVTIEWYGYRVRITPVMMLIAILVLIMAVLLTTHFLRILRNAPQRLRDRFRRRRENEIINTLTAGFTGVFAGHERIVEQQSQKLSRIMPNHPLSWLLAERAAAMTGHSLEARRLYTQMLDHHDLAPLGRRGLFDLAHEAHDVAAAHKQIEQTLLQAPDTLWALEAAFDMAIDKRSWSQALDLLQRAEATKHFDAAGIAYQRARLMAIDAWEHRHDTPPPRRQAERAVQFDPDCHAAAIVAAQLAAQEGLIARGARFLEHAWKRKPHPAIAYHYAILRPGDSNTDRLQRLKRLLIAGDHDLMMRAALARAALALNAIDCSRDYLQPLLTTDRHNVFALLNHVYGKNSHAEASDIDWLNELLPALFAPTNTQAEPPDDTHPYAKSQLSPSHRYTAFNKMIGQDFSPTAAAIDVIILSLPPAEPHRIVALTAPMSSPDMIADAASAELENDATPPQPIASPPEPDTMLIAPNAPPTEAKPPIEEGKATEETPLPVWDPRIQGIDSLDFDPAKAADYTGLPHGRTADQVLRRPDDPGAA